MPGPQLPSPPAPNPLLTGFIDIATDKLLLKPLLEAAPAEYRELLSVYVPAIRKLTETELYSFTQVAGAGIVDDAAVLLRSKMSIEELVAEKRELTKLTVKMADLSSARIAARNAMIRSTMFAALKLALLAV